MGPGLMGLCPENRSGWAKSVLPVGETLAGGLAAKSGVQCPRGRFGIK